MAKVADDEMLLAIEELIKQKGEFSLGRKMTVALINRIYFEINAHNEDLAAYMYAVHNPNEDRGKLN